MVKSLSDYEQQHESLRKDAIGASVAEQWDRIVEVQKKVFGVRWPHNVDQSIQKYCQLLFVEIAELLEHTSFKVHKPPKKEDMELVDLRAFETADIFIYTLALAATQFNSAEEFLACVNTKLDTNDSRSDW